MGLTLSASDFSEVFRRPKEVALGVVGHFIIMPLLAFGLAIGLDLPKEIAVGVILVGCCPSGTSSNVMVFLARGNVALAVAIASVSTILAPIVTPLLILLFASKWVDIDIMSLIISIIQVVIIPLALGFTIKSFWKSCRSEFQSSSPCFSSRNCFDCICCCGRKPSAAC